MMTPSGESDGENWYGRKMKIFSSVLMTRKMKLGLMDSIISIGFIIQPYIYILWILCCHA